MAKLKGPLFSLGASGKLADTLVFFPWKGLNVVREYVIPANPQTSLQTTQRGYVTAAVQLVHDAQAAAANPLDSADQVAYSALASAKGKIMTWFNQACKLYLDVIIAGQVPIVYRDGTITDPTATGADMIIYLEEETGSTLAAGKFFLGTSKTNLIQSMTGTLIAGVSVDNILNPFTTLTVGVKYYWQFRPDVADGCEGANSGIYSFVAT